MAARLETMLLGDVIRFGNGKSIKPGGYGAYPVYGSNGIIGGSDDFRQENGIIIGRVGAYCGAVAYCPGRFWASDNTLVAFPTSEKFDTKFLFYLLTDARLSRYAGGAAQPLVTQVVLKQVKVAVPPLFAQRRISGILSAYDDLIENSQRRIQILETMARALYREWFVHFRFPESEKASFISSSLGEIPAGWSVVNLEKIGADEPYAINGGPFGSKLGTKDYVPEGVPVIRGSNLSESGRFSADSFVFVSQEKAAELRANLAKPGDIIVTQRGTLGQLGMIPLGIGFDSFVISQSQMKITVNTNKASREYVFFFLRSDQSNGRIKSLASSSGVPHINLAVLREFQVLLPPIALQEKFGEFAKSTELAVETLSRQIQNLRSTRDLLLPRLLSGQVPMG